MITLNIANDFSKTPGLRYANQTPSTSGEEFRNNLLEPQYLKAVQERDKLVVILDGTDGYIPSFLEEAFGGLQRNHLSENILDTIEIISNDEKHWIDDIKRYVKEAGKH